MNSTKVIGGIVIAALAAVVLYMAYTFSQSADSPDVLDNTGNTSGNQVKAEEVVNTFFEKYITAETDWSIDPAVSASLKKRMEAEVADYDSGMIDPVLCSEGLPTEFSVEMMPTEGADAVAEVNLNYESGVIPVNVMMQQEKGNWEITDIMCGSEEKLSPEFLK